MKTYRVGFQIDNIQRALIDEDGNLMVELAARDDADFNRIIYGMGAFVICDDDTVH